MKDYEDSRAAFEEMCRAHYKGKNLRDENGVYLSPLRETMWQAWTRALDWRDSQACGLRVKIQPTTEDHD